MENLKQLEKRRRKEAGRSNEAMRAMQRAFREMWACEKAIAEIRREKNPEGVWRQLARIEAGIELLGRVAMKAA